MTDKYTFAGKEIKRKKKLCELQKELSALLRYHSIYYSEVAKCMQWSRSKGYNILAGKHAIKLRDVNFMLQLEWPSDVTKMLQRLQKQ